MEVKTGAKKKGGPAVRAVIDLGERRRERHRLASMGHSLSDAWMHLQASQKWEGLSAPTRKKYTHMMERARVELPPSPTAGDVSRWLAKAEGRDGEPLSASTKNTYLAILKSAATTAWVDGLDDRLAVELRRLRKAKTPVKHRRCPPTWAVRFLVENLLGTDLIAVRLAAFCGLRRGEIVALRVDDIEQRRDGTVVVNVRHTWDNAGERPRKNAKNGARHCPVIDDEQTAREVMYERGRAELRQRAALSSGMVAPAPEADGRLLGWWWWDIDNRMEVWLNRWPQLGAAFPPGNKWHAFRHWGATQLSDAGRGLGEIMSWLGDSTPDAAICYLEQVRGTSGGGSSVLASALGLKQQRAVELPPERDTDVEQENTDSGRRDGRAVEVARGSGGMAAPAGGQGGGSAVLPSPDSELAGRPVVGRSGPAAPPGQSEVGLTGVAAPANPGHEIGSPANPLKPSRG